MVEGIQWSPYRERMKELIDQINVHEMKEWGGKDVREAGEFKTQEAYGGLKTYSTDKAEKIALGDFFVKGEVHYGLCTIIPGEAYNVPFFISRWEEREKEIILLVDLMPTVDSLIDEEYRKKYFDSIQPLWERYASLPGICPEESDVIRSLCSIIYTAAQIPIDKEGMRMAALAPHTEYLKAYLNFLRETVPVEDETKRKEIKRKREAIRKTLSMCYQDLLRGPMGKALGSPISELMIHMFF
ncbi:MAG TPA: hypothetical protein VMX95_07795 [Thermodesulfobacteriota bacterium]|nr:hypothetical protein [Thermodesulfobacteriota bacterium]